MRYTSDWHPMSVRHIGKQIKKHKNIPVISMQYQAITLTLIKKDIKPIIWKYKHLVLPPR